MWFSLLRVNWVMPRTILGLLEGNGMEVWMKKGCLSWMMYCKV